MTEPTTESSIEIDAPADTLWALVSDVTRTREWSPVCYCCEWLGDPQPVVGARFRGYNRLNGVRWSRECVITQADPVEVFAFSTTFRGQESTRWRYRFEPAGNNNTSTTTVSEAYQIVLIPPWLRFLRRLPGVRAKMERDTRWNITESLARLKAIAEGAESEESEESEDRRR